MRLKVQTGECKLSSSCMTHQGVFNACTVLSPISCCSAIHWAMGTNGFLLLCTKSVVLIDKGGTEAKRLVTSDSRLVVFVMAFVTFSLICTLDHRAWVPIGIRKVRFRHNLPRLPWHDVVPTEKRRYPKAHIVSLSCTTSFILSLTTGWAQRASLMVRFIHAKHSQNHLCLINLQQAVSISCPAAAANFTLG